MCKYTSHVTRDGVNVSGDPEHAHGIFLVRKFDR